MRILALLLTFFIWHHAVSACSLSDSCCGPQTEELSSCCSAADAAHSDTESPATDDGCTGCLSSINFIAPAEHDSTPVSDFFRIEFPCFVERITEPASFHIWQPPKI